MVEEPKPSVERASRRIAFDWLAEVQHQAEAGEGASTDDDAGERTADASKGEATRLSRVDRMRAWRRATPTCELRIAARVAGPFAGRRAPAGAAIESNETELRETPC